MRENRLYGSEGGAARAVPTPIPPGGEVFLAGPWERRMNQTYTAVVKQQAECWIGWIEEVPGVNCQEPTREELLATLRASLSEAIEFNRAEALGAAGKGFEELPIAV